MTRDLTDDRPPVGQGVVEYPVAKLRPWEANPRRISERALADLGRALEADREMLSVRPLIATPDGVVFCGNQRLRAAIALGWETILVAFIAISHQRAAEWALRDNNVWGEWDEPLLAELLAELAADGVDLTLTGFDGRDLDRLLAGFTQAADPDDSPPLPSAEPESQPGERYQLGDHRLLCADARDADQVAALFRDQRAEVLLTDPPYGIDYVGKTAQR